MDDSHALRYKDAGVDTKEGGRAVALMKAHAERTFNKNVLTGLGGFASLFQLDAADLAEPVLVSGTDGVGTKLKIAFMMDKHDSVGIDCVAMCANDVLCTGAKPLFFLDYIATGTLQAEKIADIVKGVSEGCREAGCALVGGETAEMPGFYEDGEYDMAGFCVGVVDKSKIITGEKIQAGDAIVGIASSGIHSNGYSLVRKIFFENLKMSAGDYVEALGRTLGDALLSPTKIYARSVADVTARFDVHGIVHITGGGFYENVPRVLPQGIAASFSLGAWRIPPIFDYIAKCGNVEKREMFSTFNMGLGMMLFVKAADADAVVQTVRDAGESAEIVGRTVRAIHSNGETVIFEGGA